MKPSQRDRVAFAGVGVQKSATGWLFRALEAHPGTATPVDAEMKEVNYFNHRWHLGHGWYEAQFPASDGRPRGEFSVEYAAASDVPDRMRRYNGDLRLILCLRDPIERAFSQHRYLVGRGLVPPHLHRFSDAWEMNPSYAEQSTYAEVIERFVDAFSAEQLLVVDYDHVRTDPGSVLERTFRHVGVDPQFVPASAGRRFNSSRRPRGELARRVRGAAIGAVQALPHGAAGRLRRTPLAGRVNALLTKPVDASVVPALTDDERRELRSFFEADVQRVRLLADGVGGGWLADGPAGGGAER